MKPDSGAEFPECWTTAGTTACGARVWIPSPAGESLPRPKSGPAPEIIYFNDTHGGIDRLLAPIKRASASLDSSGGDWLTLAGGDDHGGGSTWDAGFFENGDESLALKLLSEAQVDVCVPGNHDLDWGWDAYSRRCANSPGILRVLSNLNPEADLPPSHHPYLVLEFQEHVMAILGALCTDQTREAHLHLSDPAEVLPHTVDWFHKRVDSVVVLSHLGYRSRTGAYADQGLLGDTPDDVLVLGAHTHDVIPSTGAWHSTRYLQCGQKGRFLGFARRPGQHWRVRVEGVSTSADNGSGTVGSELSRILADRGTLSFPEGSPGAEQPSRDGYTGECATINAATDVIHDFINRDPDPSPYNRVTAFCVRFFGPRPIAGEMSLREWVECFPYGDALCSISIPLTALPDLLLANARRLEMPPHFLESRGMLHFSQNLTYTVAGSGKSLQVHDITLNGLPISDHPSTSKQLEIWTQAYVAEGMGGYARVFAEAGLDWSRERVRYQPVSIREVLWKRIAELSDAERAGLLVKDRRFTYDDGSSDTGSGNPG